MRPALLLAAAVAAGTLPGCARAPTVQPYGSVASGGRTRPLSAKEVGPVDDFLNRHPAQLGILAAPAPSPPAAPAPGSPAADKRRPDLTIR